MRIGAISLGIAMACLFGCNSGSDSGAGALRGRYNLVKVNGATMPVLYYVDPGGTFSAIADSGYLNFFGADSLSSTRYVTVVYSSGPVPASAYELIRFVQAGETLILFHGGTPDTATVIANTIIAHRTDGFGTDQGYWTYIKQ